MLRFKNDDGSEFPEWEEHEIAELIQLYNEKVSSDCQLPILTSSKKNGIEYQEEHFTGKQRHDIEGYNVLPRNYCTYRNRSDGTDFTFNINKLCDKGIVSKFYPVFKEKDCDLFFLVSLLNNERKTVRKIAYTAKGTGQKVLSITDLRNITVNMPSFPEQQKIADFLSTIDTVIEKQKETVSAWEERKKGVMQKLFSQEVRFKADDGSEFPEWEEKKFSEIFEKTTNKNTCYGTDKIISVANMYYKEDASVSNEDYLKTYNVMLYGDIAFEGHVNKEYSHGRFVLNDIGDGIVSHIFDVFHPKNLSLYSVGFWKEYIRHEPIMGRVLVRCTKSSTMMRNLVAKEFLQELVPVPCLAEQQKIADCLSSLDDVIEKQKATLAAWEELKKGLLQQMFV